MNPFQHLDLDALEVDELASYIIQKHHQYEKQMLPIIMDHLHALGRNTNDSPELVLIYNELTKLEYCLDQHMRNEKQTLFPFINTLLEAKKDPEKPIHFTPAITGSPLRLFIAEHEIFSSILNKIRLATNNYTPSTGSHTDKKRCYAELCDFDADMHAHIYLENNILFPKLIALEHTATAKLQTHPI